MLESLGNALKKGFDKIAGAIFVDKKTIETIVKDLQRALIQADVNIHLVKELGDRIKKAAEDEKIKGVERKEHLIKLLHDEILNLLGNEKHELSVQKDKQTKIMLIGLYGAGKTTTIAKLSLYYQKRGFKVAMLGLDVHRPAATDQLEQLGEQTKIQVFTNKTEKNPIRIYNEYKPELDNFDLIIIDTAGRHSLDKELVSEIKTLTKTIKPDYKLLTIQADIGQAAKTQASEFQKAADINGVIITRMDSTAKAGGALTACNETKAPVYFIGTGEKMNDFESFNPKSFISRLLGLGDLEGLLEKVQSATDEKSQKKLKEKLEKGSFNLRDLQEQLKSMSGMGSLSKIAEMIPGLGKAKIPDNLLGTQEDKMKKWQHAINSMTEEEINNPEILEKQTTRLGRIAKGSGTSTSDIRQLLKQYKLLKEMTQGGEISDFDPSQGLSQKQMMKLAKKFGKKMRI
ncbi:MAG: signal recognition particle receptor subunit alpha [Candidatus Nanoarchaeia archaeon]|nr:signal recognition particle receptor subunit alpha [Candidatus Nanoarchaeia archaeon]MDD5741200.1 signal recognition particle receptor subunit alpha [Candidatus Nanoarchaeia archaeon]